MSNLAHQLKFNLKACVGGGTLENVMQFISMYKIVTQRESITVPATGATGRKSTSAGVKSEQVQLTFHSSNKAEEFWAMAYEVINTDSAEMDFAGTMNDDVISDDNPQWSGTAVLLSLDTGTDVGALRQQTITLDVTDAGTTVVTTPPGS